ncbi:DBP3 [Sanghuangporus weigelae]
MSVGTSAGPDNGHRKKSIGTADGAVLKEKEHKLRKDTGSTVDSKNIKKRRIRNEVVDAIADEKGSPYSGEKRKKKRKHDSEDTAAANDDAGREKSSEKKTKKKKRNEQENVIGSLKEAKEQTKNKDTIPSEEHALSRTTTIPVLSETEVSEYLSKHGVSIDCRTSSGSTSVLPEELRPILSFSSLLPRIPEPLHSAFASFKEPTPIQACSWPASLDGRDVIGIAETGSGKTLAFGIPAICRIVNRQSNSLKPKKSKSKQGRISVLAVAPTRELALQTHETFSELGKSLGLTSIAVYGGVDKAPQRQALKDKNAAMIVGTPGRMLDLVNDGSCDLSGVRYLVLDEADRMLDKGFENDIRAIIGHCAPSDKRQTLMFSATWPDAVRRLASTFLRNPVRVTVGSDDLSANTRVEQVVEVFDDQREKDSRLLAHLQKLKAKKSGQTSSDDARILVFVLYKKEASRVEQTLQRRGFSVGGIHGDLSQAARTAALDDFKTGKTQLLVATDVAARGLDIPNVGTVINYSFPLTVEDYVHRIGRTGRGGRSGKSITFFTGDNHERALAGELAKVLREAGFNATPLKKFPMTIKKKEHSVYGAFYRDDIPTDAKPTRMRHRPKDVSLEAYVLDLHRQFPLIEDRESGSHDPTWRDRALKLEKEVNNLKRKYEEDLAELSILRKSSQPEGGTKKKRKLNSTREGRDGSGASAVSTLQYFVGSSEELAAEIVAPELSGALSLFNSYSKLFRLSSVLRSQSDPDPSSYPVQLLSSATNVFLELGKALQTALSSDGSEKLSSGLVDNFNVIISSTLSWTASTLNEIESSSRKGARRYNFPSEQLNALFSSLTDNIVIPIIKLFTRLSDAALVPILSSTRRPQRLGEDPSTPCMKAILQGFVVILKGIIASISKTHSSYAQSLLDIMKLTVIAEIELLWTRQDGTTLDTGDSFPSVDATTALVDSCMLSVARLSRRERIRRLARKNALWYLCVIARDVLSSQVTISKSEGPSSDVAQEKFDVTLSSILVRCTGSISTSSGMEARRPFSMSDVEKGMIVSVIENIWLYQ